MVAMTATAVDRAATMRAVVRDRYGSPDVLRLEEVGRPDLTDDGALVRVRASSVNRADWYGLTGVPMLARPMMGGIIRPKDKLLGADFAGVVEAVGRDVTDLKPGDEVFGGRTGAFGEYVCVRNGVALKPSNLTFEEAAAAPVAGLTALQGLRDHGRLQPGQRVLVNGASGGVGTFAVQLARALGAAKVTAVCSTRNVELVRSLGADRVIDYSREDFTRIGERYDILFDVAGSKSWSACKRVLEPHGTLVQAGGPKANRLLGPLGHIARKRLASLPGSRRWTFFVAKFTRADMNVLRELLESGQVRPVVDAIYPLGEVGDALRRMGEGHVQGKLVITM